MKPIYLALAVLGIVAASSPAGAGAATPFDVVIENGHIIDGTGSPWYAADIGIRDGQNRGHRPPCGRGGDAPMDARGKVVAPGFIDMLGQSELTILVNPQLPSKIFQGITTEITGEGGSVAPLNDSIIAADRVIYEHYGLTPDWRTLARVFRAPGKAGNRDQSRDVRGCDAGAAHGAGRCRQAAKRGGAGAHEGSRCARRCRTAPWVCPLRCSTRLRLYASTEELIALASEASKYGGVYATHMRTEGAHIFEAIDEAVRIGREAKIPVEIWHLKAAGKPQWGLMPQIVAKIDAARRAASTSARTPTRIRRGSTARRRSFRRGRMTAVTRRLIERLKDPAMRARIRQGHAHAECCRGTTSGRRFRGPKRF